ncbi:fibro-slime domain-containing protein [Lachnospiraceae bacterium 42-17]
MQKLVREYLNELRRKQRKRRKLTVAAVLFSVAIVGSVIWALAKVGIATTGEARCGREEHQHTEECYSDVLNCGQEEGGGHTHADECYQTTEPALVCGMEESEEHTHAEACWQASEPALVCGQEEAAGHTHADVCYTKQLACTKEEHQHEEECYIDKSADVEDASVWNTQYENIEWENAWGRDLVTAAKLQLDYKESAANYIVAEDGSHKGYTRYGQFNGDSYADWDAPFVNFCMYYAGLKTSEMFPDEKNTAEWYDKFVLDDDGKKIVYLTAPKGYEPQEGDIVFLKKENEETAFQMGIVSSYNKEDKEKNEFKVIEGNSENQVKENTYKIDDERIFEYLKIGEMEKVYKESQMPQEPEQPEQPEEDVKEPEEPVVTLTTEVDGVTITLFGPESSFEAGREYAIQAEKVEDEEVLATVEEAVEQMAEEKEKKVENFQPYDIKILADGEEVQPVGPVSVKFSGQEVVKAVEDEKTEVSVIHVDETTGTTTDMEAVTTDEKDVVIETEHFSVYVYVNLEDIFGKIKVTIEHWGENIVTIDGEADASVGKDTVYEKGKTSINTQEIVEEIYASDTIELPNEYYADITKLSKLCNAKTGINYDVSKVGISNDGGKTYREYSLSSEEKIKDLKNGSIIRFYYAPKKVENVKKGNVTFYDYDISDGYYYNSGGTDQNKVPSSTRNYLKTENQGVNATDNFTSVNGKKLMVGQYASGNRSNDVYPSNEPGKETEKLNGMYLNRGNGKFATGAPEIVEGIVQSTLNNGKLQFNVKTPKSLFESGAGTTVYNDYTLGFKQNGDTYTLQYANKAGEKKTKDLTELNNYSGAYSNLFWPLDGLGRKPGDPDLGAAGNQYNYYSGGTHANNDDKGTNHNWHFGMTFSTEFTVGDYTGPMELYFRGDDDFWLFIDGKKAIDIGGIHSATGESIDLREWMQKEGMLEDKTATHTMKVFYMERGGFGSCCYLQFILPNASEVEIPEPETTEYSVTKEWDDNNSPYRPTQVEVTLIQQLKDENGNLLQSTQTNEKIILPHEDTGWTYKWTGLPKINGETSGKYDYTYSAKEINLPPGYISAIDPNDPSKLVNKLSPVSVEVVKEWINDSGNLTQYRPTEVILRLYASKDNGRTWEAFQDNKHESGFRDVILKASEGWKSKIIDDLPEYCNYRLDTATGMYSADKVLYSVREMYQGIDGNLYPVEEGQQLAGAKGANYKVSYSDGTSTSKDNPATLKTTNTLLTKFKMVKKGTEAGTPNLEGAKFILTPYEENNAGEGNHLLEVVEGEFETNKETLELPIYDGISDSNGVIQWTSRTEPKETEIRPGVYIMKETEAPMGYMLSGVEWIITVTKIENEEGSTTKAAVTLNDNKKTPVEPINVSNDINGELVFEYAFLDEVLYELPSTGGFGIYWYMFSGILLMLAAALITYRNKRREVLRS